MDWELKQLKATCCEKVSLVEVEAVGSENRNGGSKRNCKLVGQLVFCISLFSIFTFFAVGSYNICLRSPSIQLKGPHSSISISIPIYLSFDFKWMYWPQVHTIGDIMINIGDSNPKITDTLNR